MIALREEIPETKLLLVRNRQRRIAIEWNLQLFYSGMEKRFPNFFAQFRADSIKNLPAVDRAVAGDLIHRSRRYRRHEPRVFTKVNRPIHNAIDRGVVNRPAH